MDSWLEVSFLVQQMKCSDTPSHTPGAEHTEERTAPAFVCTCPTQYVPRPRNQSQQKPCAIRVEKDREEL